MGESGMLCGLQKFSIDTARRKASIPKLQVCNNALKMVYSPLTFTQALTDRKAWGRIFESGIGAYLVSQAFIHRFEIFYWRERNDEVDFILRKKGSGRFPLPLFLYYLIQCVSLYFFMATARMSMARAMSSLLIT